MNTEEVDLDLIQEVAHANNFTTIGGFRRSTIELNWTTRVSKLAYYPSGIAYPIRMFIPYSELVALRLAK